MGIAKDIKLILSQPGRGLRLVGSALWNWRSVALFVEEKRRGEFFSVRGGSLTEEEHELLEELVAQANAHPGPIIEIGTLLGATTTRMAEWASPEKKILTVDNYSWNRWGLTSDTQFDLASLVLYHHVRSGQIHPFREDKNVWCADYSGEAPSLVFCDAIHTYEETKADIDWARRVKASIVAGHDYSPSHPGVMRAVDEAGGPARLAGTTWAIA